MSDTNDKADRVLADFKSHDHARQMQCMVIVANPSCESAGNCGKPARFVFFGEGEPDFDACLSHATSVRRQIRDFGWPPLPCVRMLWIPTEVQR